ncbi:unnamed protein product [Prunus armeniaca]|uniref:Uncharacterized protein n=1 Tax=Prunus armeniaca TaxID=36596 RepID=A0A6J5VYV4_PRUAR|nr:unnamed protein product [Prunus armeniaca]
MELLMRAKQLVLHLKIQAGQVSVLKFCNFIVCQGYHILYQWYRLVESEHFPDPTGLRARIEQWTFGLHPACIKYFMSALDVPDVWKALLQTYFYSSLLHSDDEEILSGYGCHPKQYMQEWDGITI